MKKIKYRLRHTRSMMDMVVPLSIWTVLLIITLGVLLPFFFVYVFKELVDNTVIENET